MKENKKEQQSPEDLRGIFLEICPMVIDRIEEMIKNPNTPITAQVQLIAMVLDRALGSGAFSTVYRAVRRDNPGIEAAIKVISVPASDAETAALRMEGMNETQTQSYYDDIARQYVSEIDLMEDLKE